MISKKTLFLRKIEQVRKIEQIRKIEQVRKIEQASGQLIDILDGLGNQIYRPIYISTHPRDRTTHRMPSIA
ncbi:hypothetical protein [uncultured Paraglaciecola sp.]|uniref:hypothetical protein n=1 Tax=uncultured Paraglaciecola sp. TaxID=1765024 RepID=UPI0025D4EA3E|nr:hypothetical protein [uncultured Paraglaciecola sp.]